MRGGGDIELVSCGDTTHCTAVSPPLALGDTFEGDFPLVASDNEWYSLSTSGAGLGYRQVSTAALPAPPVNPLAKADMLAGHSASAFTLPANYVGAPIYMYSSPNDGYVVAYFN